MNEPNERAAESDAILATVGLVYVSDATVGIRRVRQGDKFVYMRGAEQLTDEAELKRIASLAIPPAYEDVWICRNPKGHLQATGRDARGRKQYRYHPRFRQMRDQVKYSRLPAFAQALRKIRRRTAADVRKNGLPREKVLAAAVQLLEKTLIRIGNEEYARANGSVGLTTMRDRHAKIRGAEVRFEFRGKSGVAHAVELHDARLARIVKACRDLPGYELFQYVDDKGDRQTICSDDVNNYLRHISGDDFTAKDFRTWAGTVLAAQALARLARFKSQTEAKRNVVQAIAGVAKRLGNTKSVCRKCYIHPAILAAYMDGKPMATDEAGVAAMIGRRLRKSA